MNNKSIQYSAQLQWSQSQLALLQQCKDTLTQTEQRVIRLAAQACNVTALRSEIDSLRNKLSEFDSGLFIVTTIGMLKAGKSTLVNLLARSGLASPTGFGFDTTLRPVLITQSDENRGQIQIWFKNDGDKSSVENSLDEVFAVVRGTLAQTAKAHFAEHPLNDENLKNTLCKKQQEAKGNMLPKEPLLVVVKVPAATDALLSDKIAILDTPGLDSGISEWSQNKDNCYRWILRRSDLILFLQSSVAPLNETAAAILREIQKSDRSAPIWLVHNVMEAKHWLRKEDIEQESQEQQAMANAIFKKAIGGDFSSFQANLGKAHSVILKSEQVSEMLLRSLLQESNFESLESSIKASLNSSSGKIRKQNCCSQALKSLNGINNALEALLGELQGRGLHLKNEKDAVESMLFVFRECKNGKGITDSFKHFDREKVNINKAVWDEWESWERKLVDKINAATVDVNKKYPAAEINVITQNIASEFCSEIHKKANSLTPGDITLNTAGDGKSTGDITRKLLEIFEEYIQIIARKDPSGKLEKFVQNNPGTLPSFKNSLVFALPERLEGIQLQTEGFFKDLFQRIGFGGEKYDTVRSKVKASLEKPLKSFYTACNEKVYAAVLRWINETALTQLVTEFDRSLVEEAAVECKELDEKIGSLEKILNTVEKLKKDNCWNMKELLERIRQENE